MLRSHNKHSIDPRKTASRVAQVSELGAMEGGAPAEGVMEGSVGERGD